MPVEISRFRRYIHSVTRGLALMLLLAGSLHAADQSPPESDDREARLTTVEGTVYVHLHGQPDGEFIAAEADAPVEEGDLVRTGTDGRAEVTLDGETVIEMSPNTDFLVNSLAQEQTEFHVGIGAIVAKIKTLLAGRAMRFTTVSAVAAVRGTELGVSQAGDDSPARIGVFDEGHVSVTTPKGGGEVKLGPGQETDVARGAAPGAPGALRAFAPARERMQALRRRQAFMRLNWRPRALEQRQALRRALAQRRSVRADQLRNVRADIARRRYARQQQRRQQIRQRVQQLRQQQERRQKRIQELRRQKAEQHRQAMEQRQRQHEQQRREDQARDKVKEERFEQMRAERQRRQEERRKQVVEERQKRMAQQREERRKKKREQDQKQQR